jgi:hypothetical protein
MQGLGFKLRTPQKKKVSFKISSLDKILEVEEQISEKKNSYTKALKFWMKMRHHSHLCGCFFCNVSNHTSVVSPVSPNGDIIYASTFLGSGSVSWWWITDTKSLIFNWEMLMCQVWIKITHWMPYNRYWTIYKWDDL